ncbi:MAG: hypothetical protein KDD62_10945, partial [Bdellovibrionales bacterium]|nr:hypothetical protein [Bdellovibrionales bacterium]
MELSNPGLPPDTAIETQQTLHAQTTSSIPTTILGKFVHKLKNTFNRLRYSSPRPIPCESVELREQAPQDYAGLMKSFSSGLMPNFRCQEQRELFKLYYELHFDGTGGIAGNWQNLVAQHQLRHPEFSKPIFSKCQVSLPKFKYKMPDDLKDYCQHLTRQINAQHTHFLRPSESREFWKSIKIYNPNTGQKFSYTDVCGGFDKCFPQELCNALTDQSHTRSSHYHTLFKVITEQRSELIKSGYDVSHLSQILCDIAFTAGLNDPAVTKLLKSKDPLTVIHGLRQGLALADEFAIQESFPEGFSQLLSKYGHTHPTGFQSPRIIRETIGKAEARIQKSARIDQRETQRFTVRQLSPAESPFRGKLGNDCSSHTYFPKGLEPVFVYFTLTGRDNISHGQVSIALGTALDDRGKPVVTGFVDKIQNFNNEELPYVLEAIRRSLAQKGIELSIPIQGRNDHNGISNDFETRRFIENNLEAFVHQNIVRNNFRPFRYKDSTQYYRGYSQAFKGFDVKPLLPLKQTSHATFELLAPDLPWTVENLHIDSICAYTRTLKGGNDSNKIDYIKAIAATKGSNIEIDPEGY